MMMMRSGNQMQQTCLQTALVLALLLLPGTTARVAAWAGSGSGAPKSYTAVELCKLYSDFDTNGDGKITKSSPAEMKPFLARLFQHMHSRKDALEWLINHLMTTMGEVMDYHELLQNTVMKKNRLSVYLDGSISLSYLFNYYDSDKNGTIEKSEFVPLVFEVFLHEGRKREMSWENVNKKGVAELQLKFPNGITSASLLQNYIDSDIRS